MCERNYHDGPARDCQSHTNHQSSNHSRTHLIMNHTPFSLQANGRHTCSGGYTLSIARPLCLPVAQQIVRLAIFQSYTTHPPRYRSVVFLLFSSIVIRCVSPVLPPFRPSISPRVVGLRLHVVVHVHDDAQSARREVHRPRRKRQVPPRLHAGTEPLPLVKKRKENYSTKK